MTSCGFIIQSNLENEGVVPSGVAILLDSVGFLFARFGAIGEQIALAEGVAESVGLDARQITSLFDVNGQSASSRRNAALTDVPLRGYEEHRHHQVA